jgi:predicted Zn finger-like uncharacterized protein
MSLATRCPSCTTTFKVVRDQLRISDGWVRCGRCSHVFDATLELHEMADGPPAAPAPGPVPGPPPEAASEAEAPAPAPQAEPPAGPALSIPAHGIVADELWSDFEASPPEWRPPPSSLPPFPNIDLDLAAAPSPPPPRPPLPALRLQARELAESAVGEEEGSHEFAPDRDQIQMQKALRRARIKSAKIAQAREREEERAAEKLMATSSMVRQASEPEANASPSQPLGGVDASDAEPFALFENERIRRRPWPAWQRPSVRRAFWVLAALALLLLASQVLRHERDAIVARQPGLRPALAALCRWSGCELTALRRIGDIVIEGAAFTREKSGGGDYRLSFTLRNGAAVPLAMPAIELSLLDSQERAVVRRVLTAVDYGAPVVLAARADHAASLPLSLSAPESTTLPQIAGYRVEAFYP